MASDKYKIVTAKQAIWCTITIPASSASAGNLEALVRAGFAAAEDVKIENIVGWRIFKEKDIEMAAYNVGDDASLTVAEAFGKNEPCTSADYPVAGIKGLESIFVGAAADAAITAGFVGFTEP
jgi:hypothetical protein